MVGPCCGARPGRDTPRPYRQIQALPTAGYCTNLPLWWSERLSRLGGGPREPNRRQPRPTEFSMSPESFSIRVTIGIGRPSSRMSQYPHSRRPILRKVFLWVLFLGLTLYVIAVVFVTVRQRQFIYFPPVFEPETVNRLATADALQRWNSPAGQPLGWMRRSPVQPAQGQVLITHGNAGCAFQCRRYPDVIQQVADFDVFMVEYPGYADRPGKPSERSLDESADEAFQSLATNGPVFLVGESLGTGVAAYLAGKHPDKTAGVVLLAPYNRLADVAQAQMPLFPVRWMLLDRFPSEDHLRDYHGPVAILVSGKDRVIPAKFGRRLYDGYAGAKRLLEFPEGNHGTVMEQPPEIWKQIVDFWLTNQVAPGRRPALR
jgi:uncharacterized protein